MITKTAPGRAKTELSREAIVERALAIADAEGLEAVTIRRVALEFGVTPMALYWHVQNKDELLAAMGRSFFDGIGRQYDRTGAWDDQIRGVLEALIGALRKHPASAMLTLGEVLRCEEGQEIAEFALDVVAVGQRISSLDQPRESIDRKLPNGGTLFGENRVSFLNRHLQLFPGLLGHKHDRDLQCQPGDLGGLDHVEACRAEHVEGELRDLLALFTT